MRIQVSPTLAPYYSPYGFLVDRNVRLRLLATNFESGRFTSSSTAKFKKKERGRNHYFSTQMNARLPGFSLHAVSGHVWQSRFCHRLLFLSFSEENGGNGSAWELEGDKAQSSGSNMQIVDNNHEKPGYASISLSLPAPSGSGCSAFGHETESFRQDFFQSQSHCFHKWSTTFNQTLSRQSKQYSILV